MVDSYDAMIYNRAYRKAMSVKQAQAELRRCAGNQFDPTIVAAMLQMLEEQEQLRAAEGDAAAAGTGSTDQPLFPMEWSARQSLDPAA